MKKYDELAEEWSRVKDSFPGSPEKDMNRWLKYAAKNKALIEEYRASVNKEYGLVEGYIPDFSRSDSLGVSNFNFR